MSNHCLSLIAKLDCRIAGANGLRLSLHFACLHPHFSSRPPYRNGLGQGLLYGAGVEQRLLASCRQSPMTAVRRSKFPRHLTPKFSVKYRSARPFQVRLRPQFPDTSQCSQFWCDPTTTELPGGFWYGVKSRSPWSFAWNVFHIGLDPDQFP